MKRWIAIIAAVLMILPAVPLCAQETVDQNTNLALSAESCILMEASTGKVIYSNNEDERKAPASVTKIMTLLLAFEHMSKEKMKLSDLVTVSEHAASMGGSQVYLEPGESQTVETMIKCIAVSSANDASVALGEHISGSEEAFVKQMNKKAKELGMENTNFVNCCGLDAEGHVTTARDIALMSRELTVKYPEIFQYTTIWMDEITHKTRKGESLFGLSSTNKLLKTYAGCNGLKTGSTSKAKFCISATASRNNISLIAVVMACPDSKSRSRDITALFDYGFANVSIYEDHNPLGSLKEVKIQGGEKETALLQETEPFEYALLKEETEKELKKEIHILEEISAPLKKGEIIGEIEYSIEGKTVGVIPIRTKEEIKEMTFFYALKKICQCYL